MAGAEHAIETMPDLTAETILGKDDTRIEPVDVPEWGGRVYVRSSKGTVVDEVLGIMQSLQVDKGLNAAKFSAEVVARTVCDRDGKLLFTVNQAGALREKDYRPVERLATAGMKMLGIDIGAQDAAGKN